MRAMGLMIRDGLVRLWVVGLKAAPRPNAANH
ncbi:MAG: hypothetical protein QOF00_6248 [Pseudonocardiales bacterium]|jgi:hypothetical protein|nr:hypothetical protein [Pseudonocardiales bacterium]